jgi:tetratricopeptide (TPR) repeat protein
MLEDLENRWRDEQTPQAGVRLADALQQQGDRVRAEDVLAAVEARLEAEPRDLASRVAVGGLRLTLGQPKDAVRVLEQVVQADSTHLKANKLLVEVYLELGQRDRARDRLDLYRLLNEGDPEIESLEGLVVGVVAQPPVTPVISRSERRLSLAGGDPFSSLVGELPPSTDGDLLFELSPPPQQPAVATATLGALYQEQGHHDDAERVFRNVIAQEPDNLRAQEGLAALAETSPTTPPASTVAGLGDDADSDRQRRVGILREYLARIERGRGLTTQ